MVLQNLASVHSVNMAKVSSHSPGVGDPTSISFSFILFPNLAQSELIIRRRLKTRHCRVDFQTIL